MHRDDCADTHAALEGCIDELDSAGRHVEALAARLSMADGQRAVWTAAALSRLLADAATVGLEPLTLDAESLHLVGTASTPEAAARLGELVERAAELGLALLELRLKRRLARCLERLGAPAAAKEVAAAAYRTAVASGAALEARRLAIIRDRQ